MTSEDSTPQNSKNQSNNGIQREIFAALRTEITMLANPENEADLNLDSVDETRLQNCLSIVTQIEESYYADNKGSNNLTVEKSSQDRFHHERGDTFRFTEDEILYEITNIVIDTETNTVLYVLEAVGYNDQKVAGVGRLSDQFEKEPSDDGELSSFDNCELDHHENRKSDTPYDLVIESSEGHTWYATEQNGPCRPSFDAGYTTLTILSDDRVTVTIDEPTDDGVTTEAATPTFRVIDYKEPNQ